MENQELTDKEITHEIEKILIKLESFNIKTKGYFDVMHVAKILFKLVGILTNSKDENLRILGIGKKRVLRCTLR